MENIQAMKYKYLSEKQNLTIADLININNNLNRKKRKMRDLKWPLKI